MDDDVARLEKALAAIQSLRERLAASERAQTEPIAVVGLGCRFPGAPNPRAFWRLLREGRHGIGEPPEGRWDLASIYDPDPEAAGKLYARSGGFIRGLGDFEPEFFGVSPREAARLDPQQRLLLEVAWEALEDAGIDPRGLEGSPTGVFVGVSEGEWLRLAHPADADLDLHDVTGAASSVAGGRLSYVLGLRGPNISIDTACSSSLVAVHLAINSLRLHECDQALAGGVNALLTPDVSIAFCRARALAADGMCKTFDAAADGYSRGEGCGLVVLKRLSDAQAANDNIVAILAGSAINQDGRTNGLTAPSASAQQAVIRKALQVARVDPGEIGFIETHGTGTPLGDPIEVSALGAIFAGLPSGLPLGAVKTNIGHLEAAAGIAGLIKAILVLKNGEAPPNLHLHNPNPNIPWSELPFVLPTRSMALPEGRTAAGVSSFGFSGTNAHVVLRKPPNLDAQAARPEPVASVLTLSARSPEALKALEFAYVDELKDTQETVGDICYTANTGRAKFPWRVAVVGRTTDELREGLAAHASGEVAISVVSGQAMARGPLAFLFPGQGSQFPGMGRELYGIHAGFRRNLDQCDALLREEGLRNPSLLEVMFAEPTSPAAALLHDSTYAQPALFAVEMALVELWEGAGIRPEVVLGHSVGEYAAACSAGVFGWEQGLRLVARRGALLSRLSTSGLTAAVFAPPERVVPVLSAVRGGTVSIAAENGPRETLVGGSRHAVEEVIAALKARDVDARILNVGHAAHSPPVEEILEEFAAFASGMQFLRPKRPLISNVTGEPIETLDAPYWATHLRQPVRFSRCVATLEELGCNVMLEAGPQPVLQLLGRQNWKGAPATWLTSMSLQRDEWGQALEAAGELFVRGVDVSWDGLEAGRSRRKVSLPTYPFQRRTISSCRKEPAVSATPLSQGPLPRQDILSRLVRHVARRLEVDPGAINPGVTFVEVGADSLVLARIVQDVLDDYDVEISIAQLFEGLDTFERLADHVAANARATPGAAASGGADRTSPTPVASARRSTVLDEYIGAPPTVEALLRQQLEIMGRQLEVLEHIGQRKADQVTADARMRPAKRLEPHSAPEAAAGPPVSLSPTQQDYLARLSEAFRVRSAGSRSRAKAFRKFRVDTRMRLIRPETKAMSYPIVAEKAHGARFWDIDGNEYVDLAMGVGVLLCGHDPDFVQEGLRHQMERGLQTGPIHNLADEVAESIIRMTGVERVFFGVTGTCAVRGALRIAQSATGRSKFVMFAGSYHGQDDRTLGIPDVLHDPLQTKPSTIGISEAPLQDAFVLPYNKNSSLEVIRAHAGDLAAVIVEPVQSRNPHVQPKQFLQDLRRLTAELGIPLIFDEVITGFRIHPRGAQAWFDVQADLVVYGKAIGGGMPLSIVGGKASLMNVVDGGEWINSSLDEPLGPTTYIGSTFEMHPAALAASKAMLRHMEDHKTLQADLNAKAAAFFSRLETIFEAERVPIQVLAYGSVFRFAWKGNASYAFQPLDMEIFHLQLIQKGVYTWEGRTCFLSTAHSDSDLDRVVAAVREAVSEMKSGGFLLDASYQSRPQPVISDERLTDDQELLLRILASQPSSAPGWTIVEHLVLRGSFDPVACANAVQGLVRRHPALRTVFPTGKRKLVSDDQHAPVEFEDLTGCSDEGIRERLVKLAETAFDLSAGPLFLTRVIKRAPDHHHLVFVAHHLIADGWSFGLLLGQFAELYAANKEHRSSTLEPGATMDDLIERQSALRLEPRWGESERFWRERDPTRRTVAHLRPTATERPLLPGEGDRRSSRLDADLTAAIKSFAKSQGYTLFMVLLAAYGALLRRQTRADRVTVGVPQSGRWRRELEDVVGYCSHMIPFEIEMLDRLTVAEHLARIRITAVTTQPHGLYPLARLLLGAPDWDPTLGLPLTAIFNLDRANSLPRLPDLAVEFGETTSRFALVDLRLDAIELEKEIWLDWDYRLGRVAATDVQAWSREYETILRQMLEDPEALLGQIAAGGAENGDRLGAKRRRAVASTRPEPL